MANSSDDFLAAGRQVENDSSRRKDDLPSHSDEMFFRRA